MSGLSMNDFEKIIKDTAREELDFVHVERQEEFAGCLVYYTLKKKEKRGKLDWRVFTLNDPHIGMKIDWDNVIHRSGEVAKVGPDKQDAIWNFLWSWSSELGIEGEILEECAEIFGWDRNAGVFYLTPAEVFYRSTIAKQVIEKHLKKE